MRLHNLRSRKPLRRALRAQLTPAEAKLWSHLQRNQFKGKKFRRRHSIGPYVVDFFCAEERLAIELDGAAHDHAAALFRDQARDEFLMRAGVRVIRFENRDLLANLEGVLSEIGRWFHAR